MRVVVDTREQAPYDFAGASCYAGTVVEQGSLSTGDYSLKGLEHLCAVERKSLPDFVACLGRERDRFVKELERGRGMECFAVVVEGDFASLAHHDYRGQLDAHSACQSVASFVARLRVPVLFAGSRLGGQYAVWSILRQYLQGKRHELKAVEAAIRTPAKACPAGAPEAPAGACARGTDKHKADEPEDLQDAFGGPAEA
jgi:ERCC4-type nuclease